MITTDRLIIRIWTEDLVPEFFELSQDEGFTLFSITDYRQSSVESAREWVVNNKSKYAVIEKSTGKVLGMGGLTNWDYGGEKLVDVTYRLRSSAQGKGYGFELAQALIHYAFNELDLDQVTATITPDNVPSKKLAEKIGMKFDRRILLLGIETGLYRLYRPRGSC